MIKQKSKKMSKLPDEAFRDTIGTIDAEGNRKFVFPKKPSGKFYEYRKWVSYFLLIILIANPFIKINGIRKQHLCSGCYGNAYWFIG